LQNKPTHSSIQSNQQLIS